MTQDHKPLPEMDIVFTVRSPHRPGRLGKLLQVTGGEGGLVGDITTLFIGKEYSVREITISVYDLEHQKRIEKAIKEKTEAELIESKDTVFENHIGGKIRSKRNRDIKSLRDLRYIYTPGVARVCTHIQKNPETLNKYTNVGQSVGIFTNGTRVLGLGNIGPRASMPVMEGKAVIYDQFVGLSATPILVDTNDPKEFVNTVEKIAPTFAGIHLEDIRVPDCFYIEDELIKRLNQPVMHDDQHGTATVTLAAVMSALRITGKRKDKNLTVAQIGLGASGFGIAKLLMDWGLEVIGVDLSEIAQKRLTQHGGTPVELETALKKADIVISSTGVPGLIKPEQIKKGQIILALSNPVPEISPEEALGAGAAFAADGKSVNNALAYPGLFKAALDLKAPEISSKMKIAAAEAISKLAYEHELVPSPLHKDVHKNVIQAIYDLQ